MSNLQAQAAVNLIGPLLIGNLFNYGKIYLYSPTFRKDKLSLTNVLTLYDRLILVLTGISRSFRYPVLFVDVLQACFSTHAIW